MPVDDSPKSKYSLIHGTCDPFQITISGYDMINYLKNDTSLTQDDVFVKESQVNHHSPVNHRSPAVNPECRTRYSFHAEFDGCLTVQKGQILFLQRHNNDGWSLGNGFDLETIQTLTGPGPRKIRNL